MVSVYLDDSVAQNKQHINRRMKRYDEAIEIAWQRLKERFSPRQIQNMVQSFSGSPMLTAKELMDFEVSDGNMIVVELSYMERCALSDEAIKG